MSSKRATPNRPGLHRRLRLAGSASLVLVLFALGATGLGCSSEPEESQVAEKKSKVKGDWSLPKPLRFAGSNGLYVLRRLAAEAGVLLVLDEVRTPTGAGADLAWEHVDLDLEAGPLEPALEAVREAAPGFDFRVANGVLFVRTARALAASKTEFDFPVLPATQIEADLPGFTNWLMQKRPLTFLRVNKTRGEPVYKRVDLTIPEGATVMEAILLFAAGVDRGLRLRRGGYEYQQDLPGIPDGAKAVVSSTLQMWEPLEGPRPVPKERRRNSLMEGIATLADKYGVPITVVDRTVLGDLQGSLCYGPNKITDHLELEEALDLLLDRYDGPNHFTWQKTDGVIEITARVFEYFMTGRELFEAELRPGTVKGSFHDLTRYINANRKEPSERMLWAGEFVEDAPKIDLEIPEGMTVQGALRAYAKQTGEGWYYVTTAGMTPKNDRDEAWAGAKITRLAEWGPKARIAAWH